jgi:hypothetical protein
VRSTTPNFSEVQQGDGFNVVTLYQDSDFIISENTDTELDAVWWTVAVKRDARVGTMIEALSYIGTKHVMGVDESGEWLYVDCQ